MKSCIGLQPNSHRGDGTRNRHRRFERRHSFASTIRWSRVMVPKRPQQDCMKTYAEEVRIVVPCPHGLVGVRLILRLVFDKPKMQSGPLRDAAWRSSAA